ncbi:hypothetical protein YB2330_005257 [Saitoella coloradoensis]
MRERSRSITLSLLARDRLRGEQNPHQNHTSQSYTNPFSTASFLSSIQQPLYPGQSSQSARHSPEPPRRIIDKTPFLAPAWGGETLDSFKFQLSADTTGNTGAPSIPTFAPLPEIDDQAYLSGYSFYDDIPPLFDGEAGSAADGSNKLFGGLTTLGADGGVEQSSSQAPMAKKRRIATPEIEGPVMGFEEFLFGRTGADGMEVKVSTASGAAGAGDGARGLSPDTATRDPSPTSSSPARTGSMAQPRTTSSTASTTPYLATLSYSGTGTVTPLAPGDPTSSGIPPIGAENGDATVEDPLGAALANIDWSNGQGIDQWPDFLHHFPLDPLFVQPGYDQWGLLAGQQQSLDQPGDGPHDGTQEGGKMPTPIVQRVQPSITISHTQQPQFIPVHNPQPQSRLSVVAQQRLQQQQRSYTAQQSGRQAPMASLFEYAPFVDPMNTPTVTPPQGVSPPSTAPPLSTLPVPGAGAGVGVGVGVRAQQLQPRQGQMAVVIPANPPVGGGQGMTRIPSASGAAPPRPGVVVVVAQQGQQGTQTPQQQIAQARAQAQAPPAQQPFPLQPLQPGQQQQQQQRPGPPQQRPSYPLPLPRAIPPPAAKIALAPLPAQPTPPPITPLSSVDLDDITVAECKRLLRQRNLCAVGRKEVLVGRLREWAGEGKV